MDSVDILIAGGGMAGCFAALRAARRGGRVVLLERRAFLGREITAYRHAWISREGEDEEPELLTDFLADPQDAMECTPYEPAVSMRGEVPLFLGTVKKRLLARLREAGVQVLFMTSVAGVAMQAGQAVGLLIADKYGLQLLMAREIFDLTETGAALGCLSPSRRKYPTDPLIRFAVEFDGLKRTGEPLPAVPESLAVGSLRLHLGKRSAENGIVEFSFPLPGRPDWSDVKSEAECLARHRALAVTGWLRANAPQFAGASAVDIAYESFAEIDGVRKSAAGIHTVVRNLPWDFCIRDLARCRDAAYACVDAAQPVEIGSEPDRILLWGASIPFADCTVFNFADRAIGLPLRGIRFNLPEGAVRQLKCDVLVAGVGTGGVMTAMASGRNGADTLVVEMQPDFGGTRTQGRVAGYYHGYRGGITGLTDRGIADLSEKIRVGRDETDRLSRLLYYNEEVFRSGCRPLVCTQICAARMKGRRVTGAVMVNGDGLFTVESHVLVDATGDGDVSRFAGVPYTFGDPSDGSVQSCSMWGQETRPVSFWKQNRFMMDTDVVSQEQFSDWLRGVYQAHAVNSPYDFSTMLAFRESRHFFGDFRLEIQDILGDRAYQDCIAVAMTPMDTHGVQSSLFFLFDFRPFPNDVRVRIPYRCCLPLGVSGMLLSAKSISATRDAACYTRMTADIQNLGYALGLAAAEIADRGIDVRDLDLKPLQKKLRALGILPDWAFEGKTKEMGPDEAESLVDRMCTGDREAYASILLAPSQAVCAALTWAYENGAGEERFRAAKALAWFGDVRGSALLSRRLQELCQQTGGANGFSTDTDVSELIVLLGIAGGTGALDAVVAVAELTWAGGSPIHQETPYDASRVDHQRIPAYQRILALCFALERLADLSAVPALEALIAKKYIGGDFLSRPNGETRNYFSAYLQLRIAAALARCGGAKGIRVLIGFLCDTHSILRGYARRTLAAICGEDRGADPAPWQKWLADASPLKPTPRQETAEELRALMQ